MFRRLKKEWCALSDATRFRAGVLAIILVGMVIPILIGWYMQSQADAEWEKFREQHHCKVVGEQAEYPTVGTGINPSNGLPIVVVGVAGGQTGYLCDNGITYWR